MSSELDVPPPRSTIQPSALVRSLAETAETVVPWFYEQMPKEYLLDTDVENQRKHLSAIIGARASGAPPRMTLKNHDGSVWTFIHEESRPGILAQFLGQLPRNRTLGSAKVHTGRDGTVVLDVFRFEEALRRFETNNDAHQNKLAQVLSAAGASTETEQNTVRSFVMGCSDSYLLSVSAERIIDHIRLYEALERSGNTQLSVRNEPDAKFIRFSLAMRHVEPRRVLERLATHIGQRGVDIHRAYLDTVFGVNDRVNIVSLVLGPTNGLPASLEDEVRRMPWMDARVLEMHKSNPQLSLNRTELTVALVDLAHALLGADNPHAHSTSRMLFLVQRHSEIAARILKAIEARFVTNPETDDVKFESSLRDAESEIAQLDDPMTRSFFLALCKISRAMLKVNLRNKNRFGVAMRLDPSVLSRSNHQDVPHGVFFVHGPSFVGFHVRFRDVARGGVRVVRTRDAESHVVESRRVYDEVYHLAFAQQLKNKDIPEGGSKAVILTAPGASVTKAVHGFVDGLLDLISPAEEDSLVDRHGAKEMLYLGPDENITPELIEWIVERAEIRGLRTPSAFMSSKPSAGVNHKEFGVTSEGVIVFLEEALLETGINPRARPFTIKMTGGPDGDVAGNCIRIARREFGEHARFVGIADGSGTAIDPNGLDQNELMRLVDESLPIASFAPEKLSNRGQVISVDAEGGVPTRNQMHNRIRSDVFIPAGGRPETIHSGNWQKFVQDGHASSHVIVEGANLFLTAEARERLSSQGVLIVKDSSANKCGVICSSFEILACLLLDEEEFLGIKGEFVEEVLERLRKLARREARALFRERMQFPNQSIPALSVRLSRGISAVTDAVENVIDELPDVALYESVFQNYIPDSVRSIAADRFRYRIPAAYRRSVISSCLATTIAYNEGLSYVEGRTREQLSALALRYVQGEQRVIQLAQELERGDLVHREEIIDILQQGGARVLEQRAARCSAEH